MVTTKRIKTKPLATPKWSIGAVIVGLFGTLLLIVSLLSKPQFHILNHTVVLTQGVIAPAIMMGTLVWALVEVFTPPGKGIGDLLARIIPAFIIGSLVGGTLGYLLNFGGYVLNPAAHGNVNAIFFLISALVSSLAILWEAAWAHTHGFRGQKGSKIRKMNYKETGTDKGKRVILSLLVFFIALLVIAPIGASLGHEFVSSRDNSLVLQDQSIVTYVSGAKSPVPFGSVNGTATFDFPSTTVNTTTTYQHVVYVRTNLTERELNNFAVSKMLILTNLKANSTIELGTGNASSFSPFLVQNVKNSTSIQLNLSTPLLTGNQSAPLTVRMYANVTTISMKIEVRGNNGLFTSIGPYQTLQFAYLVGGILLLFSGFFSLSMYDVDMSFMHPAPKLQPATKPKKKGGGKK